ncbi:PDZ domain-containing protein [Candidatus Peregrinibacteria bacterium]|nr:PDZ domain-containing protein [Candidatus Peregrinibacteria bacterium]
MGSSCFRHARTVATFFLLSLLVPLVVGAQSPSTFLATPDAAPTSRADFVRASMKALQFTLMKDVKKLPYTHIPASLMPYVQTAHELGALKTFGNDFAPGKAITRGEAVEILVALENLKPIHVPKDTFTDVHFLTPQGRAIAIALANHWIAPESPTVFGASHPLMGKEGRQLLANVLAFEQGTPPLPPPASSSGATLPVYRIPIVSSNTMGFPKEETLRAIWTILNEDYLHKEKLKGDEPGYKAIEGLVQSLNDPYTTFMPPKVAENERKELRGDVTGIGAEVDQKSGVLVVVSPLPGSPAEKAGIQPGDQILAADGEDLTGLPLDEAVNKVRGPEGSTVKLHILRSGESLDVSIVRASIKLLEIQGSFQGTVAVVKLLQFGTTTDEKFRGMMTQIQQKNPTGLILDLRGNPGGLLTAAEKVVSSFVPEGTAYISATENGQTGEEFTDHPPIIHPDVHIIVLVSKGSASASEVVAGALQDAGRATVVGEQTYGKGTVQNIHGFPDGSQFKLTVAEWKTPKLRKIDGVGIKPDIVVTDTQRDAAMVQALQLLR